MIELYSRLVENDDLANLVETTVQCELIPSYLPNNVTENCLRVLNARKGFYYIIINDSMVAHLLLGLSTK